MSSISSSKTGMSEDKKQQQQDIQEVDADNPFSVPPDEKIFSFKEEEKERKENERDRNRQLKVWEKNRPTREGCLRRIGETDIEPSSLAINPKV